MATQLEAGSTFAGYRIEELVGRGGMGVVYRAHDLQLDRPVALKLIAPELASDERFRERFLRESRLAASLGHPHVLPVFAAGEEDGQLYLAMRYVEGSDLDEVLEREGTLGPERALRICAQVAEALDAAHEKGLVHRDVKPANVLLDEHEDAYLADFGITKQLLGGETATATGQIVGTLDYLAPEQIRGEEIDGRTDEYALACLLYECVSGQAPFHRETEAETLWAHMQDEPPSLPGYPELDPVFEEALAKEKEARYEACGELISAARSALGLEAPARPRRPLRRVLVRRWRLIAAVGALLLAAGIAAGVIELTGAGEKAEPIAVVPNSVAAIDPKTNRVVAQVPVGDGPTRIAAAKGGVWVVNQDAQTLSVIDPRTRELVRTFGIGTTPTDVAIDSHGVWVAGLDGSVSLVDPEQLTVVKRIRVRLRPKVLPGDPLGVGHVASGFGSLWYGSGGRTLTRVNPTRSNVVATIRDVPTGSGYNGGIVVGEGSVWVADNYENITRVDPASNSAVRVPHGLSLFRINGLAVAAGSLWISDVGNDRVWQLDTLATPRVIRSIAVGLSPQGVGFGHGTVWVANSGDGTVMRIDPATGKVVATIEVGGTPVGIAVAEDVAWVTVA